MATSRPDQTTIALNTGQQTHPAADGAYSFTNLSAGTYTIQVTLPNNQQEQQQAYVSGTMLSVATINFPASGVPPASSQPTTTQPAAPGQAFQPVPQPADQSISYFPQTQHTLRGTFRTYWQTNGGLPIFGYPISEEFSQLGEDGRIYTVQYFERYRLELHPDLAAPYTVLLGRTGATILQLQGRSWFDFPKGTSQTDCLFFQQTGHSLCGAFKTYWQSHGLQLTHRPGITADESLALFGQPLSEPQLETLSDGHTYIVQWFERARFEYHDSQGVLLGLLGDDLAAAIQQ